MRKLITILIIFISCNPASTPTEVVVKKDTVVVIDTVARKMASRAQASVAAIIDSIGFIDQADYEFNLKVNRAVDVKMATDMQTVRKEIGVIYKENDRLNAEIIVLRDSLNKFHPVWFNPEDFDATQGQNTDSVSLKRL